MRERVKEEGVIEADEEWRRFKKTILGITEEVFECWSEFFSYA